MQSKAAKNFIVFLMFAVFGVVMYFLYGPNSEHTKVKDARIEQLKTYVKQDAVLVSREHNGRVRKGATIIYTIQYTNPETKELTTTTERKNDEKWSFLDDLKDGDKFPLYVDPVNGNQIASEVEYKEVME